MTHGAAMNEGVVSTRLGLRGWPNAAEDVIVSRNVILATYTGYANSSGFTNDMYGEPRMWGVSLRYRFGAEGE